MAKRMLIDASHPEETRVVVLSGSRLEEFDYESSSRKQLKGNIYLAKVTRVEPSLQAAFVDYGGNRHGFLPFSEIHPDYYRIPVADREALIAAEAEVKTERIDEEEVLGEAEVVEVASQAPAGENGDADEAAEAGASGETQDGDAAEAQDAREGEAAETSEAAAANGNGAERPGADTSLDTLGGDDVEDAARRRAKMLRRYKIQEVIKRRQVILVQVTKEERGNKGAALTTYLSLAGRYCVLMPNTAKGGGISRKIASPKDRRRLKSVLEGLKIPDGIAVIVRTAGSERTKAEIRRDYEFLLRLWDEIRSTTLASTAPALVYEEANLIKRSIRDLYQTDTDEILVEGDEGYKTAKSFMKSLTPSHARKVKQYKDPAVPLFFRYQVESQIDAMHNSVVQLKSGGYIVIHMTEALVAIDVNSGKATRERHIEETAYKTNLEAAEEVARQLRLRDLAGLIVIDFIDMEENRHNRNVERKLKDAMRTDRARIQLGRISPFGLLELSRQRLRPSLLESSTTVCPYCSSSGYVRTTQSVALHILRGLEDEGIRRSGGRITVTAPRDAALHLLNEMRERLIGIEQRYGFQVSVEADETLVPPKYSLHHTAAPAVRAHAEAEPEEETERAAADEDKSERKRGRGRRRRRKPSGAEERAAREPAEAEQPEAEAADEEPAEAEARADEAGAEPDKKGRRRRGKRGGRRRSRRSREETGAEAPAEPALSADSDAAGEAEVATEPAPAIESDAPAQESESGEAAAPAKSRRRRRPARSKSASAKAEETAAEPAAESAPEPEPEPEPEPMPAQETPIAAQGGNGSKSSPAGGGLGTAAEPHPEPRPEPATVAESVAQTQPREAAKDEPKRRGWWQRWN